MKKILVGEVVEIAGAYFRCKRMTRIGDQPPEVEFQSIAYELVQPKPIDPADVASDDVYTSSIYTKGLE